MWSPLDVFNGLLPTCAGCGASFDIRLCAPHILPCSHTFCLMCLTKEEQKKKTRCLSCKKKYTTYTFNVSFAEVVERVRQRRNWIESQLFRCDECDLRQPKFTMRRCMSCVQNISLHVSNGVEMDCAICLECCVDKHNGHEITRMVYPSLELPSTLCCTTQSSSVLSVPLISPRGCSTPKLRTTLPSLEQIPSSQMFSNFPRTSSHEENKYFHLSSTCGRIEDYILREQKNPVYYQTSTFHSQRVSRWWMELIHRLFSIIKQCSNTDDDDGSRKQPEKKKKRRCFSATSPESSSFRLGDSVKGLCLCTNEKCTTRTMEPRSKSFSWIVDFMS